MIKTARLSKKAAMTAGGQILSRVVKELKSYYRVGITTREIDQVATKLIKEFGADLSFNKVAGYQHATCLSVNEVIVHGVPCDYRLKLGDVLKLDIGVYYGGYHVDYGNTYPIGKIDLSTVSLLEAGRSTLKKIIPLAKKGEYIGRVSQTIEEEIGRAGYQVVYELTGHAVGRQLHEEPYIPGFLDQEVRRTPIFLAGNAYALEVIYSRSDHHVHYANSDGWSLATKKGSLSACFENTVFVDETESWPLVREEM
jgi:methionyl aminopeptidase